MPIRRELWLAEGISVRTAVEGAKKSEEARKQQRQKQAAKPSTHQNEQTSTRSSIRDGVSSEEAYVLARAGVPFIEAREYQPLLKKTVQAQRLALQSVYEEARREIAKGARKAGLPAGVAAEVAEKAAAEAASRAAKTLARAQTVAILAAAAVAGSREAEEKLKEKARTHVEAVRSAVEREYARAKERVLETYREARARALSMLTELERLYNELKAKGVKQVRVDTDNDGKPDKVMSVDEWYRLARGTVEKYLRTLEEWKKKQLQKLLRWKEEAILKYTSPTAIAEAALSQASQAVKALREELKLWAPRVVEAAKRAYAEYQKARKFEERLRQLYRKYAETITSLVAGGRTELEELFSRFEREAFELAKELGVDRSTAAEIVSRYLKALREAKERAIARYNVVEELKRLYEDYAKRLRRLYDQIRVRPDAASRIEVLLREFEQRAKAIASKLGKEGEELAAKYVSMLRQYREALQRAANLADEAKREVGKLVYEYVRRFSFHQDLEKVKQEVREKVKQLLAKYVGKLSRDYIAALVDYAVSLFEAEAKNKLANQYASLPQAAYICWPVTGGYYCRVLSATGRVIGGGLVKNLEKDLIKLALSLGYKPGPLFKAKSAEEAKQIELAYLREKNPYEYMKRLGEAALTWQGPLTLENIYRQAKEFSTMVTGFFRIPAERLAEQAAKKGDVVGQAIAGIASFGAGVVTGAASFWDIPGMVEFGKQVVETRGEALIKPLAEKPFIEVPFIIGTFIGPAVAAKGLGAVKKGVDIAIGRYIPPEKLGMPKRVTPQTPSTYRLPGLDLPSVPPEVIARIERAAFHSPELQKLIREYMAGKVKPEELVKRGLEVYEELAKKGVLEKPVWVYHATPYKFPKEFEVLPVGSSPTPGLYVSPVPYPKFAVSGAVRIGLIERLRWRLEGMELPSEPTLLKLRVESVELPKLGRPLEPPPETGAQARIVPGYTRWGTFVRARGFIVEKARGQPKAYVTPEVYGGLLWRSRAELEAVIPPGVKFRELLRSRLLRRYTEVEVPEYKVVERRVLEVPREKLSEVQTQLAKEGFTQFIYSEKAGKLYAYKVKPTGRYVRVRIRIREYEPVKQLVEKLEKGELTPEEFVRKMTVLEERGAISIERASIVPVRTPLKPVYPVPFTAAFTRLQQQSAVGYRRGLGVFEPTSTTLIPPTTQPITAYAEQPPARQAAPIGASLRPVSTQPITILPRTLPKRQVELAPGPKPPSTLAPEQKPPATKQPEYVDVGEGAYALTIEEPGVPREPETIARIPMIEPTTPRPAPLEPVPRPEQRPPEPQPYYTPPRPRTPRPSPTPPPPPPPGGARPVPRTLPPLPRLSNAKETWGEVKKMKSPKSRVGELLLF